jgi:Ser/Thr protein kinase RdoA (MazF antagonist)
MKLNRIIQKNYGLEVAKLYRLEGGFRNQCFKIVTLKESFLLIIYKRERGVRTVIENAHFVAKILSKEGFPTRVPMVTKSGQEYFRQKFEGGYHYLALYNFLPGETIPWEAYTRRHLKSIGKTLSDMHYTLREILNSKFQISNKSQISIPEIQNWSDITRHEIIKMKKYFKKVEPWIEKKLEVKSELGSINEVFKKLIAMGGRREAKSDRPNVLHYDFVRGNILFSKKLDKKLDIYPITGILDFEKVCLGPEIADIARTLAFLIIDCKFKKEDIVRKRFLISGYEKRGENKLPFDGIAYSYLEVLLKFFWLRDFWKFLVHNPYEYLYMNEHYVRTRDRLIRCGILLEITGGRR